MAVNLETLGRLKRMPWLIVHAVHQLRDIKLWHIELKFYRATLRYQNETADYM